MLFLYIGIKKLNYKLIEIRIQEKKYYLKKVVLLPNTYLFDSFRTTLRYCFVHHLVHHLDTKTMTLENPVLSFGVKKIENLKETCNQNIFPLKVWQKLYIVLYNLFINYILYIYVKKFLIQKKSNNVLETNIFLRN